MGGDLRAELDRFRECLKPPREPEELIAALVRVLVACGQMEAAARVAGWLEE